MGAITIPLHSEYRHYNSTMKHVCNPIIKIFLALTLLPFSLAGCRNPQQPDRPEAKNHTLQQTALGVLHTGKVVPGSSLVGPEGRVLFYCQKKADGVTVMLNDAPCGEFITVEFDDVMFSFDGMKALFTGKTTAEWFVHYGDDSYGPFDGVKKRSLTVSAGGHFAFIAIKGGGEYAIIDGKQGPRFDKILMSRITFNATGAKSIYYGQLKDVVYVVVNGQLSQAWDDVIAGPPIMNGQSVVYAAVKGGKEYVVVDGEPSAAWDRLAKGSPVVSADGGKVVFAARRGVDWFVISGDKQWGPYEAILAGTPRLSPIGGKLTFGVKKSGVWHVVTESWESGALEGILRGTPAWTADGETLVFGAQRGGAWYAVIGEGGDGPFDGFRPGSPIIAPKGGGVAFVGKINGDLINQVVTVEGSGPQYTAVGNGEVVFSSDGARWAYTALTAKGWTVVTDAGEGDVWESIMAGSVKFFGTPPTLSYVAKDTKGWYVLSGENRFGPYQGILEQTPVFSATGQAAFGVKDSNRWHVVVDGARVGTYIYLLKQGEAPITTDKGGATFSWVAADGEFKALRVFRVDYLLK